MTAGHQSGLLGDILAAALREDRARAGGWFMDDRYIAATALAGVVAGATGLPYAVIFDQLTRVPEAMLELLQSPEGWGSLSSYLAAHLGAPPIHYLPTRH